MNFKNNVENFFRSYCRPGLRFKPSGIVISLDAFKQSIPIRGGLGNLGVIDALESKWWHVAHAFFGRSKSYKILKLFTLFSLWSDKMKDKQQAQVSLNWRVLFFESEKDILLQISLFWDTGFLNWNKQVSFIWETSF